MQTAGQMQPLSSWLLARATQNAKSPRNHWLRGLFQLWRTTQYALLSMAKQSIKLE